MQIHSLFLFSLCSACASVPAASSRADQAEGLALTRQPELETVRAALELVELERIALAPPTSEQLADPGSAGFWHGAAYAFSPAVREARARLLAQLGEARSAGASGPIQASLTDHEFGGGDARLESVISFDLIGWLGLGPSGAQRELAREESLLALAQLESALWSARFEVDRARLDFGAARERVLAIAALSRELSSDLARVDILARRGRLSAAQESRARASRERLEDARAEAEQVLARARGELARASGLPAEHAAFERVPRELRFDALEAELPESCENHPRLRAARLAAGVAEARLRAAAAEAWPGLRLGPHLGFPAGDGSEINIGGALQLSWPVPGAYRGRIAARAAERDRSLERYQEEWLELGNALLEARTSLQLALERRDRRAPALLAAAGAGWSAVRARFRVGRATVGEWSEAVERELSALTREIEARRATGVAWLELAQGAGPREVSR